MDDTQVEKFDPSKLMDGVKDRIKATFVSMIPDNHWEKLIEGIIDRFMNSKLNNRGYTQPPTEFEIVVREELTVFLKEKVAASMLKYMDKEWDKNGNELVNKHIKKILIENSEAIIASMFANATQNVIANIQNNIR